MKHETDNRAAALRERVLARDDRYWSLEDLGDPAPAELRELSRLVKTGELRRVRRGLYWRGRKTPFGMAPPPETAAVRAMLGGIAVGPAGASAATELGLSTQVPAGMSVAAPRRLSGPSGMRVHIVTRSARVARSTAQLRAAEVALLEVLESWERHVESSPSNAVARVAALVGSSTIDLSRVVKASVTEPPIVRARLRALLEALGENGLADRVAPPRTPALLSAARSLFVDPI